MKPSEKILSHIHIHIYIFVLNQQICLHFPTLFPLVKQTISFHNHCYNTIHCSRHRIVTHFEDDEVPWWTSSLFVIKMSSNWLIAEEGVRGEGADWLQADTLRSFMAVSIVHCFMATPYSWCCSFVHGDEGGQQRRPRISAANGPDEISWITTISCSFCLEDNYIHRMHSPTRRLQIAKDGPSWQTGSFLPLEALLEWRRRTAEQHSKEIREPEWQADKMRYFTIWQTQHKNE